MMELTAGFKSPWSRPAPAALPA